MEEDGIYNGCTDNKDAKEDVRRNVKREEREKEREIESLPSCV